MKSLNQKQSIPLGKEKNENLQAGRIWSSISPHFSVLALCTQAVFLPSKSSATNPQKKEIAKWMFSHMWAGTQAGFSHQSAGRQRLCKDSSKHRERSCLFPLKLSVCTCSIPCWSQDIRMRMFYSVNHIVGQSTFHTESFFNIMFPNQTFLYNLLKDNSPKKSRMGDLFMLAPFVSLVHIKVCCENCTDINRMYYNTQHKQNRKNLGFQDSMGYGNCHCLPWVQD